MASKSRVGEILIKARVIDDLQLRSAKATHEQWGGRLGKIIADMGLADEDTIVEAISKAMGMQRAQLGHLQKDPGALARLEVRFAEDSGVFPVSLKENGKTLVLAMADPTDLDMMDAVASKARARITPLVAGETEIQHAIMRYYKNQEPGTATAPRARQAARRAAEEEEVQDDGEEFKITDMSGKTMIKHIGEIEGAPSAKPAPPVASFGASTGDLLDDMMAGPAAPALSAEEQQRLDNLKLNHEKSAVIVRAVAELLVEKGYCTQKELTARVKL